MQITIDFNKEQIYTILNQLNMNEKLDLVKKLEKETFEYRLKNLENTIEKSNIDENEILKEIKSIRNQ